MHTVIILTNAMIGALCNIVIMTSTIILCSYPSKDGTYVDSEL